MKLLELVRVEVMRRGYSQRTADTYRSWIRRFILFHQKRHPNQMGPQEVRAFLAHLHTDRQLSPSSRNQAASALGFLYRHVLEGDASWVTDLARARNNRRLPTVPTNDDMRAILGELKQPHRLIASLMYGSGLRLNESVSLRLADLEFESLRIVVRRGKGNMDRTTVMPRSLVASLQAAVETRKALHESDLARGAGWAELPNSLQRTRPRDGRTLAWQWVFPGKRIFRHDATGLPTRHHLHHTAVQRAVKNAVLGAAVLRNLTCHSFRHGFATNMLRSGVDIQTVQQLMGHQDVRTTMLYIESRHVGGQMGSPIDAVLADGGLM